MAEIELHTETVIDGEKAKWPFETGYSNPTKNGYLFDGWEYNGTTYKPPYEEATNPFGPITENTDIKAKWDKLTIHADTNHTIISGNGDADDDLTKLMYWVSSDNGLMITNGVTIEDVPLDGDNMLPIIFDGAGSTAVVDNKNVKTVKVKENDINKPRYYRFKSKYSIAALTSDIVEIKQVGKDQTILPPFDYLTFTYNWTAEDGRDLDSATIIRNSHLPITASTTLDDYFVGYGGTNNSTVTQYLQHGGDNTSSGDEGAMVNWKKVCDHDFISEGITTLYLDIYANWYVTKGNGKMSISFKTYKGNDGLVKNGFIFEPTGDTVQVSNAMLSNLYVNAQSSQNANKGINGVKSFYSKIATVEYDIRTKSAVLVGEYSPSGRDLQAEITFNGVVKSCTNGGATVTIDIDKNPHSGTVTLSSIRQTINGVTSPIQLRVDNATVNTRYYDGTEGIPDDYVTYTVSNNSDGGIDINWNCAENNSGSSKKRNCDIHIQYTSSDGLNYSFRYGIYQSAT